MRLAAGSFILNSGIGKLHADEITAKGLHSMAMGTYPFVDNAEPMVFARSLGRRRNPDRCDPAVAVCFAALGRRDPRRILRRAAAMYRETPGMTEEDGVRPTKKGVPLAKDVWMLGIGLGLMIDGLTPKRKHHKPARTAVTPPPAARRRDAASSTLCPSSPKSKRWRRFSPRTSSVVASTASMSGRSKC